MPEFYTTHEVADILRITEKSVRNFILRGKLEAMAMNGNATGRGRRDIRIPREALDAYIQRNMLRIEESN